MVTTFSHSYKGGGIWPTQCQPRPFFPWFFYPLCEPTYLWANYTPISQVCILRYWF